MRLTDISIRALKAPEKGAFIVYDDALNGFGVRISVGGTKSFVLTHGPRRERETLGRFGVVTLHEARAEAKRRLAEYTLGKERPRTALWDDAVAEYLEEVAAKRRPRTHESYKYALEKHFRYGATRLSELRPHDLDRNLRRLMDRPAEQQHAYVALRAFVRWAYRKYYFERSPMDRMRAPHPYVPRERVLSDDELRIVWHAAGDATFGKIVKLLILTGQREGEIAKLTGAMVGEDKIIIPAWLAKNNREHRVPLGAMANEILSPRVGREEFFFPNGRHGSKAFSSFASGKLRLDERSGVGGWRLHDLRRTFASGMASIGVPMPVVERLLNHVSGSFGGIVGVYQRYNFLPEMRDAVARWENHVERLIG